MGFSGDFAQLNEIASHLERVPLAIRNRVAISATDASNELLAEEFAMGVGPDRDTWEPLATSTIASGRHNPPLGGTSVSRDVRAVRRGTSVEFRMSQVAEYHQRGHSKPTRLPKREMIPGDVVPERWQLALSLAANNAILEAIGASGLQAAE